jgi:hypothetical protein
MFEIGSLQPSDMRNLFCISEAMGVSPGFPALVQQRNLPAQQRGKNREAQEETIQTTETCRDPAALGALRPAGLQAVRRPPVEGSLDHLVVDAHDPNPLRGVADSSRTWPAAPGDRSPARTGSEGGHGATRVG